MPGDDFGATKGLGFFPLFFLEEERTVEFEALQAKAVSPFVVADASHEVWLGRHWHALKAGVLSAPCSETGKAQPRSGMGRQGFK